MKTVPRGINNLLDRKLGNTVERARTWERVTHRSKHYFASQGISGPDWKTVHRRVTSIQMPGKPGWAQIEDTPIDHRKPFDANQELPDQYSGLTMRTVLYYCPNPFVGVCKRQRTEEPQTPTTEVPETAIEDEDEVPEDEDEQQEDNAHDKPEFWPSAQELRDLKITHDNAGHPSNADFARLLRRGHCRPEVAAWVRKHFRCAECEANKRPTARRPAAVPRPYRFNHVVGIDLVKVMNPVVGHKEWWCNIICW